MENGVFTIISNGESESTYVIIPNGELIGFVKELHFSADKPVLSMTICNHRGIANEQIKKIKECMPLIDLKVEEIP